MRFQLSPEANGKYAVYDTVTGQKRYSGSLDGARQSQAQLNASWAANR